VGERSKNDVLSIVKGLVGVPLMSQLPPGAVLLMAQRVHLKTIPSGTAVLTAGETASDVLFVLRGSANVIDDTSFTVRGSLQTVAVNVAAVRPLDTIGLKAVRGSHFSYCNRSVVSSGPMLVLSISGDEFASALCVGLGQGLDAPRRWDNDLLSKDLLQQAALIMSHTSHQRHGHLKLLSRVAERCGVVL
jgi:CRP-like cAMP-binding protein